MTEQVSIATLHEINPSKTDAVVAMELKDAMRPLLDQVAKLMSEARNHGMQFSYSINTNAFGQFQITELNMMKLL